MRNVRIEIAKRRECETQIGHVATYTRGKLVIKFEAHGIKVLSVLKWRYSLYGLLSRDCLELTEGKATAGECRPEVKVIWALIYLPFRLNVSRHGGELCVLGEPA